MSTNYYLIDKKDKETKEILDSFIEKEIMILKDKIVEFCENDNTIMEDNFEYAVNEVMSQLKCSTFEPVEIQICKTTSEKLLWKVNEEFENIPEFIRFLNENVDKYLIMNEYYEIFTYEEFQKKVLLSYEGNIQYGNGAFY